MPENIEGSKSWPDLAIGLYDLLTGRGAEITHEFDNMEVAVPSNASNSELDEECSYFRENKSLAWKSLGRHRVSTEVLHVDSSR